MKADELRKKYAMDRHIENGAFITCITVPRFTYEGFELIEKEKMLELYPKSRDFWKIL